MKAEDDKPEAVRNRLKVYHNQTAPILPYYRAKGLLQTVDGMAPIDDVSREIDGLLKKAH